jgi:L-ribulose-5-phosphate 3-epimerase
MHRSSLRLGIYEKALDPDVSWAERLESVGRMGFDFVEMSVDETEARLSRLAWSKAERHAFVRTVQHSKVAVSSLCLSGHRRYPFGSHDPSIRAKADQIMAQGIRLAVDLGIRVIQIAGYDVYYEQSDPVTREGFLKGMTKALELAAKEQVMLAIEIMDHPFINSISNYIRIKKLLDSPWLAVYPDVGNLSAWGNDLSVELELGINEIVAIHLKDTVAVTPECGGVFKNVPFGTGCVDFSKVFSILDRLDYDGPFLIEMWYDSLKNPVMDVLTARKWLYKKMAEGGVAV